MLDNKTIIEVLETNLPSIKSHFGSHLPGFGSRWEELTGHFAAVAAEENPQIAASNLRLAVYKLLKICWDYEYIAKLLDQAEEIAGKPRPVSGGILRPETPDPSIIPDIIEIKEIAQRFQSLLVSLAEISQPKNDKNRPSEDTGQSEREYPHGHRTHP